MKHLRVIFFFGLIFSAEVLVADSQPQTQLLASAETNTRPEAKKVVLITGATGGLGQAAVKVFQDRGWTVWAGYRKDIPENLKDLKNVQFHPLDVTSDESVEKMVKAVIAQDGKIDTLINNAGYALAGAEECVTIKQVQDLFDVNFYGALRMVQQVAPYMRAQKSGLILNISSTSGFRAVGGLGIYAASKFALEGMSESLALTLSSWNIKVVLVEPGVVKNDFAAHYVMGARECEAEEYQRLAANLPKKFQALSAQAQSNEEVALVLVGITENPNPDMRYQTSIKVKEMAVKKMADLTGNNMRDEQLKFYNAVIND